MPFGVPGDVLLDDGALAPGPHHQDPPCRHFPECGGCQLQHVDDEAYRGYLVSRVETALAQHALATEMREPHLSPPNSRRRATLRALKVGQGAVVGFNAAKSHRIVDMQENHILRPEIVALIAPLRQLLAAMLEPRRTAEVQLTLVDQGVDVLLKGVDPDGLEAMESLTAFAATQRIARLSIDQGLGAETALRAASGYHHPVGRGRRVSRTAASSRRRQKARRLSSRRCARRRRARGVSPICSPASAPSRWRCGRLMQPRPRAMPRRRSSGPRPRWRSSIATSTAGRSTRASSSASMR